MKVGVYVVLGRLEEDECFSQLDSSQCCCGPELRRYLQKTLMWKSTVRASANKNVQPDQPSEICILRNYFGVVKQTRSVVNQGLEEGTSSGNTLGLQ